MPVSAAETRLKHIFIKKDFWLTFVGICLLVLAMLRSTAGVLERPDFFINSDSLYYAALYRDFFIDRFPLSGWALATAPCFFPEMPIFVLLAFFTSATKATVLWGAALLLAWTAAALYLLRSIRKGSLAEGFVLVALSAACLVYFGMELHLPFWEDFFRLVHPHGSAVTAMLALGMQFRYLRDGKSSRLLWLALLVLLGVASDLLFLPLLVGPLLFVHLLFLYKTGRRGLWSLLAIGLSAQLSRRLLRFLVDQKLFYLWPFKLEKEAYSQEALQKLLDYPALWYGSAHFWTLLLLGLGLVLLVIALAKVLLSYRPATLHTGLPDRKNTSFQKDKTLRYCFLRRLWWDGAITSEQLFLFWALFVWLSFGALWLASGISGLAYYKSLVQHRYFPGLLSLHLLFLLSFVREFPIALPEGPHLIKNTIGFAASLSLAGLFWNAGQKQDPLIVLSKRALSYRPPLAVCLDERQGRYNLRYGLSDYWASKLVNLYSQRGIRAYQTDAGGGLYHWVNNLWWYYGNGPNKPRYNFIITNGLDKAILKKRFGAPTDRFSCTGHTIWFYARGQSPALESHFDRKNSYFGKG